ncbi:unnamed protein product [Blepharisma stoltei]|uniref:F-box domain-containing protein n=1 Tax=Blepharisma stoltei TaxID=1481888 RepID=A0AAU9JZ03_9CILI|nr:unnamed protein product [Blepharisma stoltei]
MKALENYNILGIILSYLDPLEMFSSIQLVNHAFNHVSKTHRLIEKSFSNMLADIFWVETPLENPGIKIFAGLCNKFYKGNRVIWRLKQCSFCGRFIKVSKYPKSNAFMMQITADEEIPHKTHKRIRLWAHGSSFTLFVGKMKNHRCMNIKWESCPVTENSQDCSEWFYKTASYRYTYRITTWQYRMKDIAYNYPEKCLKKFLWFKAYCEKEYNQSLFSNFQLWTDKESKYTTVHIGEYISLTYCQINWADEFWDILNEKCYEFDKTIDEYSINGRKKLSFLIIKFIQYLIKAGIFVRAEENFGRVSINEESCENIESFHFAKYRHNFVITMAKDLEGQRGYPMVL